MKSIIHHLHRIFFYLTILLLPTQLGYHFWPEWAMVLGRRVDYLSPTFYLTDLLLLITIAGWGASFGKNVVRGLYDVLWKKKRFVFWVFTVIVLTILFAVRKEVAIYSWVKVVEYVLFGLYIIKTKPRFSYIVLFLSIAVFYSSLIAIGQFVFQHSLGGIFWLFGERTFTIDTPGIARVDVCFLSRVSCPMRLRAYGTFPHPNVLGGFLAVTIPLILHYARSRCWTSQHDEKTKRKTYFPNRLLYILTITLSLVALLVTFSRSAWTVVVVWSLYYAVRRKIHHRFSIHTIIPILLLLCALVFIGRSLLQSDESITVRSELNTAAISIFRDSPIFGVGLGNFLVALPNHLVSRQIYFLQPVHNIYLLLLSEVGIVGMSLLSMTGIYLLYHVSRITYYENTSFLHVTRYALFALLAIGLVDHYPLTLQQGQLLLTLFIALNVAPLSS